MATTTPSAAETTPDYAAITARQKQVWGSGDYATVAARIQIISEVLCDSADLRAGSRVLDVAGSSEDTALAAARSGTRRRRASTTSPSCSTGGAARRPRDSSWRSSRATPRRCRSRTPRSTPWSPPSA